VAPDELLIRDSSAKDGQDGEADVAPRPPVLHRRQELEQLLRQGTADPQPYIELARIYREEDRLPHAIRVLERAVEILPEEPSVIWEYEEARLERSYQRLREAERVQELRGDPASYEEVERCELEWANRRLEVARARLQRNPRDHHLCVVMGRALRELGRPAEAIDALNPALEDRAEGPTAWLLRGECLEDMHRPLEALAAYRAAGIRRAVAIPRTVRCAALASATSLAGRLGLSLSAARYLAAFEQLSPDDPKLPALRQLVCDAPHVFESQDAASDR